MRIIVLALTVTISLAAASCGVLGGSDILAACGGPVVDAERGIDDVDGVALSFDAKTYRPGNSARFSWEITRGPDSITTGDEWLVECWDGTQWKQAWMAMAVYDESPFFRYRDDEFGITTDGFSASDGSVVIPDDAPLGLYRVSPWLDPETNTMVRALFEVVA